MANTKQPNKLLCPCCQEWRDIADTRLLQAEGEWLATGASDSRRQPGWSVEEARAGRCQWACVRCFEAGRALEGHPALQTWCDHNPYFAFVDSHLECADCHQPFVFAAAEQRFWYETLKFWVQSRPKQCLACRRDRRARRREARKLQLRQRQGQQNESASTGAVSGGRRDETR